MARSALTVGGADSQKCWQLGPLAGTATALGWEVPVMVDVAAAWLVSDDTALPVPSLMRMAVVGMFAIGRSREGMHLGLRYCACFAERS
jgi:hypothetical protein